MKYMIFTDGEDFKIKIKTFLFWKYVKKYYFTGCHELPVGSYHMRFKSEKLACKFIKSEYGNSAIRVRKYKIKT